MRGSYKTPVELHGELHVDINTLKDENGRNVQLRGLSTHEIKYFSEYINKDTFMYLRDEYRMNVIRIAAYSVDHNEEQVKKVKQGIDYATELGMYVIVDWHVLTDKNPNINKENAKKFFEEILNSHKNNVNIIYEICNEPNGDVKWDKDIKPYEEEMINLIREFNKNAIILCGTPDYCKALSDVIKNPIKNTKNIMYTYHFYSATHKAEERFKLKKAIESKLPIFVSEFGISEATGNGKINKEEAMKWLNLLDENSISYVYWSLTNKDESSAFIGSQNKELYGWKEEQLTDAGKWFIDITSNKIYK